MAKLTYSEQLKHPKWQQRRLEVMEKAGFECSNCGSNEDTLHVHHRRYIKGRMAWEYCNDELACLCESCHSEEHSARNDLEELFLNIDIGETRAIVALVRGYAFGWERRDPVDCWGSVEIIGQLAWHMSGREFSEASGLLDAFVKKRGQEIKKIMESCDEPLI